MFNSSIGGRSKLIITILFLAVLIIGSLMVYSANVIDPDTGASASDLNLHCYKVGTTFSCDEGTLCALYDGSTLLDHDDDNDGYYAICGHDCNDTDSSVYPGASLKCDSKEVDANCDGLEDVNDDGCIPDYVVDASSSYVSGFDIILKVDTTPYPSLCCYTTNSYSDYTAAKNANDCTDMSPDDTKYLNFTSRVSVGSTGDYTYNIYCRKKLDSDS